MVSQARVCLPRLLVGEVVAGACGRRLMLLSMDDSTGRSRRLRPGLILCLLFAAGGMNCASGASGRNPVTGVITPEYFRFREVVPDNDPSMPSGGWRAVCILAQIKHGNSGAKTACEFEVGVPLRNKDQGTIPLEIAQFAAASMANQAARAVMSDAQPGEMLAELCRRFKVVYQEILDAKIKGARVSQCRSAGIETVPFGITGEEPGPWKS